ncbi:MAG TPA: hypothetical protein VE978_22585, partial [Chitinophagales bacterium]|nr:hypothetical protein [Chitinophagales bacterium]
MKSQLLLFSFLVFFIHASFAQSPPTLQWEKCFGGSGDDFTRSLELTDDGGFIFAAGAYSNDGDVIDNHGIADVWVVKADASGTIQWQHCYGGRGADLGWAIKQTADGGYFLANNSLSKNGDVSDNQGDHDFWEVKIDASGNIQWERSYGGTDYDAPYAAEQATDHGYVVVGSTISHDGYVTGAHGYRDGWVIKLDSSGNLQWSRALGGSQGDDIFAVTESTD